MIRFRRESHEPDSWTLYTGIDPMDFLLGVIKDKPDETWKILFDHPAVCPKERQRWEWAEEILSKAIPDAASGRRCNDPEKVELDAVVDEGVARTAWALICGKKITVQNSSRIAPPPCQDVQTALQRAKGFLDEIDGPASFTADETGNLTIRV